MNAIEWVVLAGFVATGYYIWRVEDAIKAQTKLLGRIEESLRKR